MLTSRKNGEKNAVIEKAFLKRTENLILRALNVSHETHDGNRRTSLHSCGTRCISVEMQSLYATCIYIFLDILHKKSYIKIYIEITCVKRKTNSSAFN